MLGYPQAAEEATEGVGMSVAGVEVKFLEGVRIVDFTQFEAGPS